MSVHSAAGVQLLAERGFSCAILARELSEEEIAAIAEKATIDLEVFIHGALCVSVSGQCYASAFLGGRSANRGACAGPCRLPFMARTDTCPPREKAADDTHHLSLKDLTILEALPRLEAMGVSQAKIEGRLRGPEYCAVVVDSARKALDGQPYDKTLLREVFSRSGFTKGWFDGTGGETMFGARAETDAAVAKKALPKARELYRRERPRVPLQMRLVLDADGANLQVTDGESTVKTHRDGPLPTAEKDAVPALQAALKKPGELPFICKLSR
jgi:putative protease